MSASQNGVFLRINGKEISKLLSQMFKADTTQRKYFSIKGDDVVIDLDNYMGQDSIQSIDMPTRITRSDEVIEKVYDLVRLFSQEFVEKKLDRVDKAVSRIKEIDWRYFVSNYESWDIEMPEGEDVAGVFTYSRFVYDSKKRVCGYKDKTGYLKEGEYVDIRDYLYDDTDIVSFLKDNKIQIPRKPFDGEYVRETIETDCGKRVNVLIRVRPDSYIYAEMKCEIEGKEWFFVLTDYDCGFWEAHSMSVIDIEDRFHTDEISFEEYKDLLNCDKLLFSLGELSGYPIHIGKYDDQYQLVKKAVLKVASYYGI